MGAYRGSDIQSAADALDIDNVMWGGHVGTGATSARSGPRTAML